MTKSFEQSRVSWKMLQSQVKEFSEKLNSALEELGILDACKDLQIDHICVRLKDDADVDKLKNELSEVSRVISAVNVNGREIAIIQLNQALNLGLWQTYGVELPHPKPNHSYADGWQHVEFVLSGAENTMNGVREVFSKSFSSLDVEKLKTDYSYSEDEPHADEDQIPNPTVGLKVNGIGIKFHANPIQVVVGFKE